jgi:hypothetical protein
VSPAVDLRDYLVVGFFLATLIIGTIRVPRFWRGEGLEKWRNIIARTVWLWDPAVLDGYVRGVLVIYIGNWLMVLLTGTILLFDLNPALYPALQRPIVLLLAAALGLEMAVLVPIVLWNRPRFLVVPSKRGDEGYLALRRRRRGEAERHKPRPKADQNPRDIAGR